MERDICIRQLAQTAERLRTGATSNDFAVGLSGKIHEAVTELARNDASDWERANHVAIASEDAKKLAQQYTDTGVWDVSDRLQISGTNLLEGRQLARELDTIIEKIKQLGRQNPPVMAQPPAQAPVTTAAFANLSPFGG